MKCGHLFNGIGGFALAASWMGWENVFHCEIDIFCNRVMKKNFPDSRELGDIKKQDFNGYLHTVELLTGGFPCQPYSTTGKRVGTEDSRHLWPEMLRAIREIRPIWVVGENVRGLTNWNGGMVFDEVQAAMEAEGYEVLPFLLPAAGVGGPHERYRIWFIAHADKVGQLEYSKIQEKNNTKLVEGMEERYGLDALHAGGIVADTNESIKKRRDYQERKEKTELELGRYVTCSSGYWENFPTKPGIRGRNDGIPNWVDRIGALGNAIVPQVALQIFKAIEGYNSMTEESFNRMIKMGMIA
jgi:DNA (cytosine-5)-methyltransferase 1